VSFVSQWQEIEGGLPGNWTDARLEIALPDEGDSARAAALLAPANPGQSGKLIRFFAAPRGAGVGPEAVRRLLARLDAEGIEGALELVGVDEAEPAAEVARPTLAAEWDAALETFPADWSDVYAEVELTSTDHLERAALLLSPLNPARYGEQPALRFRVARRFGYGASAGMTRRCLERLDEAGIPGELHVLRVLSDSKPVGTQGPVWYVGGKAV
jgi:hypothetical protein